MAHLTALMELERLYCNIETARLLAGSLGFKKEAFAFVYGTSNMLELRSNRKATG